MLPSDQTHNMKFSPTYWDHISQIFKEEFDNFTQEHSGCLTKFEEILEKQVKGFEQTENIVFYLAIGVGVFGVLCVLISIAMFLWFKKNKEGTKNAFGEIIELRKRIDNNC